MQELLVKLVLNAIVAKLQFGENGVTSGKRDIQMADHHLELIDLEIPHPFVDLAVHVSLHR